MRNCYRWLPEAVAVAGVAIGTAVAIRGWPDFDGSGAAWVQAIGSIVAILVAVYISRTQQIESRRADAKKHADRIRAALYLVERCQALVLALNDAQGEAPISLFDQVERALLGLNLSGLPGQVVLEILTATQLAKSSRQYAERYNEDYEIYGGGDPSIDDWLESLVKGHEECVAGLHENLRIAQLLY